MTISLPVSTPLEYSYDINHPSPPTMVIDDFIIDIPNFQNECATIEDY